MIEIDKEDYKIMKHNITENNPLCPLSQEEMVSKVANGIPLPKGHGRLTDLDKLINFAYNTYGINSGKSITKDNEDIIDYIYNKAEILIEADNTESEMNE